MTGPKSADAPYGDEYELISSVVYVFPFGALMISISGRKKGPKWSSK